MNENVQGRAAHGDLGVGVNVSFGHISSKSETNTTYTEASGSSLKAGNDASIRAKESLTIHGSDVNGKQVNLKAGESINLVAAEEKNTQKTTQTSKGRSIGATFAGGLPVSVSGGISKGKINEDGTSVTYKGTRVTAEKSLSMESGDHVSAYIGGDLNIESRQDEKTYDSKSTSTSAGFSIGISNEKTADGKNHSYFGKTHADAGMSKETVNSSYQSVREQAGIYAGKEGFDISAAKNTDLKGAVIDSSAPAEKNQLTTGTLTWEDIKNQAGYKAGGKSIGIDSDLVSKKNPIGLTYQGSIPVKGEGNSVTHSAIARGIIEMTERKTEKEISRDTKNALNKLDEIFDKKKVEEQQELVGMMAKTGAALVGDISAKKMSTFIQKAEKAESTGNKELAETYREEARKWEDGGVYKIGLHSIVGALTSLESGHSIGNGLKGAAVNEALQKALSKIGDPELHKLGSALIGGIVGGETGAGIAGNATEYNWLTHSDQMNFMHDYLSYKNGEITYEEFKQKLAYYNAAMWYEKEYRWAYGTNNAVSDDLITAIGTQGYGDILNYDMTSTGFEDLMYNM